VTRLAHISDLHFGALDRAMLEALVADLLAFSPDVLVVTGDLTQRARRREFEEARGFLDSLPWPKTIVCGNHDIAPWFSPLERALAPYGRFRRHIGSEAPAPVESDGIVVIGLNSADRWRLIEGGVSRDELARVLVEARRHKRALCVVAAHHPLVETDVRPLRNRVRRHRSLDEVFDQAGVDLVLTGHLHESFHGPAVVRTTVVERHVLVVQASTATSWRLRGHRNAWNAITIEGPQEEARVIVNVRVADGRCFGAGPRQQWRRAGFSWLPG
jgi:3',5'-cyclic AMP phosphodiesterase CpdA